MMYRDCTAAPTPSDSFSAALGGVRVDLADIQLVVWTGGPLPTQVGLLGLVLPVRSLLRSLATEPNHGS